MRKGIEAIVAIVLLLMMTVGAAGLAYVWVTNMQKDIQGSAGEGVEQVVSQQEARISIDSMWNETAAPNVGNISFNLRNSGRYAFSDISTFKVYVDGKPVPATNPVSIIGLSGSFAPKSIKTITLNMTGSATAFPVMGSPKTIKIATDFDGVDSTYVCTVSSVGQAYC